MKYDVDILMTAYNGEDYVSEQIESVLAQTYTRWRLLISDDCSTDSTYQIALSYAKKYPNKIILRKNKTNLKLAKNFEELLRITDAEYVAICDVDDYWEPEKIEKQMTFLRSHKDMDLVFHDLEIVNEHLEKIDVNMSKLLNLDKKTSMDEDGKFGQVLTGNFVPASSVLFRKRLVQKLLPAPEGVAQDHWCALVALASGDIGYIDTPLVKYRQRPGNMQGAKIRGIRYYAKSLFRKDSLSNYLNSLRNMQVAINAAGKYCSTDAKKRALKARQEQIDFDISLLENLPKKFYLLIKYPRPNLIFYFIFQLIPGVFKK